MLMTRIPFFDWASRRDSEKVRTAYLPAVWASATGAVLRSLTELMLMIVPDLRAAMPESTALVQFSTPTRFVSISRL
jgi:hypothetical protein